MRVILRRYSQKASFVVKVWLNDCWNRASISCKKSMVLAFVHRIVPFSVCPDLGWKQKGLGLLSISSHRGAQLEIGFTIRRKVMINKTGAQVRSDFCSSAVLSVYSCSHWRRREHDQ